MDATGRAPHGRGGQPLGDAGDAAAGRLGGPAVEERVHRVGAVGLARAQHGLLQRLLRVGGVGAGGDGRLHGRQVDRVAAGQAGRLQRAVGVGARALLQRCAAAMYATWEEASVNIHEITGGEEWAVVVLSLTMKSKKTGRTFTQTVNEAARFDDGLLKELRIHYFDAAEVTAEAGDAT